MPVRKLMPVAVACSTMLWAMISAAAAVGFPVPRGGAWEGPINGHQVNFQTGRPQQVGTVRFCVTGDRVERIAVSIEARGGPIEAHLGHTTMFETVMHPPHHAGHPLHRLPLRRETRFQIIDHKVDPRLSLSMVVHWAHNGGEQQPIIEHHGAQGRLTAIEEGRLGQHTLNHTLGPIHRVGGC